MRLLRVPRQQARVQQQRYVRIRDFQADRLRVSICGDRALAVGRGMAERPPGTVGTTVVSNCGWAGCPCWGALRWQRRPCATGRPPASSRIQI